MVGRDGKVLAHNNDAYLAFASASLAGRYDEDRLPNVERVVVEADDLVLPPEEFDAALVMLTCRITSYNVCYTKLLRVVPLTSWPQPSRGLTVTAPMALL